MRRDSRLTIEQSRRLQRVRTMGRGLPLPVVLEDSELARIVAVIVSDVQRDELRGDVPVLPSDAVGDYFLIPIAWFDQRSVHESFVDVYLRCVAHIEDFDTYFECLCSLHKRRRKYAMILARQPFPTIAQISPRALLEFGGLDTAALASWMTWRKLVLRHRQQSGAGNGVSVRAHPGQRAGWVVLRGTNLAGHTSR